MATQTDALASLRRLQGSDSSRIRMEHERRQPALRKARSWFGLTRDDAVDPSRDANSISNPDPSKFNNTPNHSNSPRTSKHVPGSASVPKSSSDSPPVASRTLKQKSSLASLKDFAGYFNPWSPVSPASPQQQEQEHDIELLRSPQSESSESSLEHTPDQTCDISFEIEQISRWVFIFNATTGTKPS